MRTFPLKVPQLGCFKDLDRHVRDFVPDLTNEEVAESAGLVYTTDSEPGIRRITSGRGFTYRHADGQRVDKADLARIRSLAIPPAYRDVWISPEPRGHLQATGFDARGRKQYRYHPEWGALRGQEKFHRILDFAAALPVIRERIDHDLRRSTFDRERVLAIAVALLEKTFLRVGTPRYARENGSYGLTTLKIRHTLVEGSQIRFQFKGKSGVQHDVSVRDRSLARIMRGLQELPGQNLLTYVSRDGTQGVITSHDVNQYLKDISGSNFTAKDFRTWAGTLLAFQEFSSCDPCETKKDLKKQIVKVVKKVAQRLGNTPAVCRQSYIHAHILASAAEQLPLPSRSNDDPENALAEFLNEPSKKPPSHSRSGNSKPTN